jgi:hypothetical protein
MVRAVIVLIVAMSCAVETNASFECELCKAAFTGIEFAQRKTGTWGCDVFSDGLYGISFFVDGGASTFCKIPWFGNWCEKAIYEVCHYAIEGFEYEFRQVTGVTGLPPPSTVCANHGWCPSDRRLSAHSDAAEAFARLPQSTKRRLNDNCGAISSCWGCVSASAGNCNWCLSSQSCIPGTAEGPFESNACSSSASPSEGWTWYQNFCPECEAEGGGANCLNPSSFIPGVSRAEDDFSFEFANAVVEPLTQDASTREDRQDESTPSTSTAAAAVGSVAALAVMASALLVSRSRQHKKEQERQALGMVLSSDIDAL